MANQLNPSQETAVKHFQGAALVLAGAGAGKTRVLTQRVAHLIRNHQISPSRILVVTFTNKAAKEMKARLQSQLGEELVKRVWVGTFHAICARLLRQEIHRLGYTSSYVIYDTDDQVKLIKEVLNHMNLDDKKFRPRQLLRQVSRFKNQGWSTTEAKKQAFEFAEQIAASVYEAYQEKLAFNNALDFDDLLILTLTLLKDNPDLCFRYQQHFEHILVDEYQDTNAVQFALVRLLAHRHHNLFVVGDVDQSIYSFRHADFQIILRFQEDFPGAKVIKLEENYRSTRHILEAANTLISNNRERFEKTLISIRGEGEPLRYYAARNGYNEVDKVVQEIQNLSLKGHTYGDFCILYRTNAQSRLFEERLIKHNIPHQLIGGFRFYDRKEIKDLMAYLKVLYNPLDSLSLKRVINTPRRGIGAKSLQNLEQLSEKEGLSLWDTLRSEHVLQQLSKKLQKNLSEFTGWLGDLRDQKMRLPALIEAVYTRSGYQAEIEKLESQEQEDKLSYIESFIQAAYEFEHQKGSQDLGEFLEHLALISDVDGLKAEGKLVTLMTVHAAKGLEFPVVFVTGLEEGMFPHQRSMWAENEGDDGPLEEERRLMYVAMTRAQDILYLTHAQQRNIHGQTQYQESSRFIDEVASYLPESGQTVSQYFKPSQPAETSSPLELNIGDEVTHELWGSGSVEQVYASGSRQIAIVVFPGQVGKRILDLSTAPLQKV